MPTRIDRPSTPAVTTGGPASNPVLREGSSGEAVVRLQTALTQAGFNAGAADGEFGPGTAAAVKAFQAARELEANGIVGPETWTKLASPAISTLPAAERELATKLEGEWRVGTADGTITLEELQKAKDLGLVKPSDAQAFAALEARLKRLNPTGTHVATPGGFNPWDAGSAPSAEGAAAVARGKAVTLTFDDGPNPVNTPKVLDILKEFGVKGTFFVTGQNVQRYPELVRRIVSEGHALANHTWDHPDLSKLDQARIKSQLERTQAAVDEVLGTHYELNMIRPPYGAGPSKVREAAPGKDVVLWNVDSNDWRHKNDDAKILQNVFDGSESVRARGGVILFHDIHPQTVRILDDVIGRLQREGYDIQRTDEYLANKRSNPS